MNCNLKIFALALVAFIAMARLAARVNSSGE
jgi:hypothetical protein